jgi:RNA polymerase sigma factor for flagellar operon FliA
MSAALALTDEQRRWVVATQDLVKVVAADLLRAYPKLLGREEMEAFGQAGLVEAARLFEPEAGVPFATFARFRILGAMLDAVRDEARFWRQRAAGRRAAALWLSETHGTVDVLRATEEGSRRELGLFLDGLAAAIFSNLVVASQEEESEDDLVVAESLSRARWALGRSMADLCETDRLLVSAVYLEGKSMREAAEAAGISYATCRRHLKGATSRLGMKLRGYGVTEAPASRDAVDLGMTDGWRIGAPLSHGTR